MDIQAIPLTDLCDEVNRRAVNSIIMVDLNDPDDKHQSYINWQGSGIYAMGQCNYMISKILRFLYDEEEGE